MISLFKALDDAIARRLKPNSPAVSNFFLRMTHLGGAYMITASAFCCAILLTAAHYYVFAMGMCFTLLATILTSEALKRVFKRERPADPLLVQGGHAMPSGHSACSLVFYGYLIYLLHQIAPADPVSWVASIVFAILILTIGTSRIYLRVHHTSDVLLGYAIGAFFLTLGILFS
jgi:membrane-associated phospholipid phosphatase